MYLGSSTLSSCSAHAAGSGEKVARVKEVKEVKEDPLGSDDGTDEMPWVNGLLHAVKAQAASAAVRGRGHALILVMQD